MAKFISHDDPVACFECGLRIGFYYKAFADQMIRDKELPSADTLLRLFGIKRSCCRVVLTSSHCAENVQDYLKDGSDEVCRGKEEVEDFE